MKTEKYLLDLGERALFTFLQAFLATFVVTDLSTAKGAALGGAAAVLALLKGVVAGVVGEKGTAAMLPESPPAAPVDQHQG